jgi:hypothetical protein
VNKWPLPARPSTVHLARFFSKVTVGASGCWLFSTRNGKGYGVFGGKMAHRAAYEWFVGPIPEGLHIDHLCFVKACANPAHLEPVTLAENTRRGAIWRRTGRCYGGHLLTPDNIYYSFRHGVLQRTCFKCRMVSRRRWVNRRRGGDFVQPRQLHLPVAS